MKEGYGEEIYSSGDSYKGQFQSNKPDGKGEYLWKNNNYYVGEFSNGLKHG